MPDYFALSLEQKLTLRVLRAHIKTFSREEAIQELIKLYRQMMIRDHFHQQKQNSLQLQQQQNSSLIPSSEIR